MHLHQGQPRLHTDPQIALAHARGQFTTQLLVDHLDRWAELTPDKQAIVEAHRSLSYDQVQGWSENLAHGLLEMGVQRGEVVAVQSANWAELPIVHFACDRIGAIFVPLSEGFRARELQHLLRQSRAKVLFCPQAFRGHAHAEVIEALRPELPDLQHVVLLRCSDAAGQVRFEDWALNEAWRTAEAESHLRARRGSADDPSHVMVSSGTTGLPRCSLYSDNNTAVKLLQQYVPAAQVTAADTAAALAPAGTGATGYNYPILTMLLVGGTSVLLEHWNGQRLDVAFDLITRHACTVAVVVPAQLAMLVQAPAAADFTTGTLRVVTNAGAKLPAAVVDAAERLFGCKVQGIYGTSEAGATAMTRLDDANEKRRSTVGRPLAGQEVAILSDEGLPVAPGEPGEVCWCGTNKSYGFLNDPAATCRVWDAKGFLHSGDLGRIGAEGYLQIVGRKKDMIIRGGQNVNPGVIEDVLLQHPQVAEVAVVPFADDVLGERIAVCVVPRGLAPSLDELKAAVRGSGLAAWHQPERLVLLPELPRNAGGKIDKAALSRTVGSAADALSGGLLTR